MELNTKVKTQEIYKLPDDPVIRASKIVLIDNKYYAEIKHKLVEAPNQEKRCWCGGWSLESRIDERCQTCGDVFDIEKAKVLRRKRFE